MFHIGMWMLLVAGIPLILILIWMYFLARRRSRRLAQKRRGPQQTATRPGNDLNG
jgi:preprotein translocase subunit YajC